MRHLKSGRKLNRTSAHRKALLRNLVTSLLEHEQVRTTDAKAKELRRVADRMITLGKRGSLHARRQAAAYIRRRSVVSKLFSEVAERFRERPGGYTRIVKIGTRHGDAAPMSVIELTDRGEEAKAEAEKKRERRRRQAEKRSSQTPAAPPV
jgi:large subunit ribosomal protein L17